MVNITQIDEKIEDAPFYETELILNDADVDILSHTMDFHSFNSGSLLVSSSIRTIC